MKWLKLFGLLVVVFIFLGCKILYPQEGTPEPQAVAETYAQETQALVQTSTPEATVVEPTNTPVPVTPLPSPTPTRVSEYTVQKGDTLSGIAETFGTSVNLLAIVNKIDPNWILAGQLLSIPDPNEVPVVKNPDGKKILIRISTQQLFAFRDANVVKEFIVSTGLPNTPTLTGNFLIYSKHVKTDMTGPDYHLKDVPWTMYYSKSYGIHGTYWHSNFGSPMSHGCTNMSIEDAKWLFDWAPEDTPVIVIN